MDSRGSDPDETEHRSWSRRLTEPPDHLPVSPPAVRAAHAHSSRSQPGSTAPARQRRKTGYLISSLAIVIIAVAIGIGLSTTAGHQGTPGADGSQSSSLPGASRAPGAGVAPAVFVVSSATATLHQHSADVTISGSVSANGQTVPIDGTGYADFDKDAFSANMTMNGPTGTLGEDEIAVGGHIYLSVGADGVSISQLTGGPHWVDVPVPEQDSSGLGTGNVDPLVQLQVLEHQGATATPLGTSTMEGETVSGYSVTPSQVEEQQAIQQEVQSGAIPQSAVPMVEQELQAIGTPTMDVYFDSSRLLRKLSVTFGGGSSPVSASVQMTFGDYGTTVSIGPPAVSDVISYALFLQDLQVSQPSAPSPSP